MENLLAADTTPLPFLAGAFERLLEEFPSTHNGLARSEQQALRAVAESGSMAAGRMFLAIQGAQKRGLARGPLISPNSADRFSPVTRIM